MKDTFLSTEGLVKRAGKFVKGLKDTKDLIKKGSVSLVVCADDASMNTKKEAEFCCRTYNIDLLMTSYKMDELGDAAGEGKIAVFSVTDKGLSELLLKAYRTKTGGTGL